MRLTITVCIAISAMVHFFVLTHSAQSAEEKMLLDGTISSAQGADNYKFRQGFPVGDTAANAYRNSLTRRAIEAYKKFLPTIATEAVIQQMLNAGAVANKIGINMDQGPRQQFAATNSDTPYSLIILDLRDGPMVVDMPANPLLLGLVNDHNMRWIENLGAIGPDKGKGGRYLFLPPGYEGDIPDGYYVSKSSTHMVVPAIRSVPLDGDGAAAVAAAQEIKVYPLGESRETTDWRWIDVSKERLTLPLLDWEGRLDYWRVLHDIIQYEVPQDEDRFSMGSLEQLEITKGAPFSPDADMGKLLSKAALAAHTELAVVLYANPNPARIMWDDRKWELIPLATMHLPKGDFGTKSLISRDAWDQYFFFGWGTSSTIGVRKPGGGSMYFLSFKDKKDVYLDGAKSYKLTMPGPVPAGLFWSVTVYDAETRVLIETSQGRAAVRSHRDSPQPNDDGSFDIHFGPVAPEGKESNWVQTLPGRGWFTTVRLYSPAKEVFDGTWRLGDVISAE